MSLPFSASASNLSLWIHTVGTSATLRWKALRLAIRLHYPEPTMWRVRPRQAMFPLEARLQGSSDMFVFHQIFVFEEYSCLTKLSEPSLVLDLGANVGYSAAYFLSIFPKAHVIAVEPDEHNWAVCKANLLPYGDRAMLLHGAVWSGAATLQLARGTHGDKREWATQVHEVMDGDSASESENVQAWDVGTLIKMSGGTTVDLLKVDIEGAEVSVFGETSSSWLPNVRNICIELHGKDCEDVFFAALSGFDYELEHSGELTICKNLRAAKGAVGESSLVA